jgi:hypothetical protein
LPAWRCNSPAKCASAWHPPPIRIRTGTTSKPIGRGFAGNGESPGAQHWRLPSTQPCRAGKFPAETSCNTNRPMRIALAPMALPSDHSEAAGVHLRTLGMGGLLSRRSCECRP